jgi:hypothetical protein
MDEKIYSITDSSCCCGFLFFMQNYPNRIVFFVTFAVL